jgi:hypothetical protein
MPIKAELNWLYNGRHCRLFLLITLETPDAFIVYNGNIADMRQLENRMIINDHKFLL